MKDISSESFDHALQCTSKECSLVSTVRRLCDHKGYGNFTFSAFLNKKLSFVARTIAIHIWSTFPTYLNFKVVKNVEYRHTFSNFKVGKNVYLGKNLELTVGKLSYYVDMTNE